MGTISTTPVTSAATTTVVGTATPADATANPTTAVLDESFLMVFNGTTWDRVREGSSIGAVLVTLGGAASPTTSLSVQSGVATGASLDNGTMRTNHTAVVTVSAGVTNGVVTVQLSQDNVNFFNAATITTNTASTVLAVNFVGAFRYVRCSITTAITGGTVTATVASV